MKFEALSDERRTRSSGCVSASVCPVHEYIGRSKVDRRSQVRSSSTHPVAFGQEDESPISRTRSARVFHSADPTGRVTVTDLRHGGEHFAYVTCAVMNVSKRDRVSKSNDGSTKNCSNMLVSFSGLRDGGGGAADSGRLLQGPLCSVGRAWSLGEAPSLSACSSSGRLIERDLCHTRPVPAYAPAQWHDFFVGSIGASAALTGLLFVAISINLTPILKDPRSAGKSGGDTDDPLECSLRSRLRSRAGLKSRVLGIEIAATGVVVAFFAVWFSTRGHTADAPISWRLEPFTLLQLPGLALLAGGLSLVVGGGGGFYWVLAATILTFLVAAINAWVLLVEILR